MPPPKLWSLRLFFICFLITIPSSISQTPLMRIVFPRFKNTPRGWTRYNPANLSPNTKFGFNGKIAPVPLRSFLRRRKRFTYIVNTLLPGVYDVKFGFFDRWVCRENKRVFRIEANFVPTPPIDLVKNSGGCAIAHYVTLKGIIVKEGDVLNVTAVVVKGPRPILNNLEIIGVSPLTAHESSVSPSASSTVLASRSLSAVPSISVSAMASSCPVPSPSLSLSAVPSMSVSAMASSCPVPSPSVSLSATALPSPSSSIAATIPVGETFPNSAKVVFFKFTLPVGWEPYNVEGLDADVLFSYPGALAGLDIAYLNHMKKRADFSYVHRLAPGVYDVRLGFLELGSACVDGKRVFKVILNGRATMDLDVYKAVGCMTEYDVLVKEVVVGPDQILLFEFVKLAGFAPFLANFEAVPHSNSDAGSVDIEINAGSKDDQLDDDEKMDGSMRSFYSGNVMSTNQKVPSFYYKSSRFGMDFTYSFDLEPGTYDVMLGFSENYAPLHCSEPGKRVFNVFINGLIQLEGFDIFSRVGCHVAEEVTLFGQSVGAVDTKPLTIRFLAVVNFAQINYIRIKTAEERCIPESSSGGLQAGADHAAHAVPGSYPPQLNSNSQSSYVDSSGDGFVEVEINGDGSHSHFFDSVENIIGRITEFKWTLVETGEVISTEEKFSYKFPLGTTRLKLAVLDNSCTRDEAETTVTVTGKIQPGQYCYYYQGLDEPPTGGALLTETTSPSFADISFSAELSFPSFAFDQSKFAVRCQFFLHVDTDNPLSELYIDTVDTGVARLYKGADLVLDTSSSIKTTTSLSAGLTAFEVIYLRTDLSVPPKLKFTVDGVVPLDSHISHDRTTVLPILSAVTPHEGKISGGTTVKLTGYGLFQPLDVAFGGAIVKVIKNGQSKHRFFVSSPMVDVPDAVSIVVTTRAGISSNPVYFSYGGTCDSVKFTETSMLTAMDKDVDSLELPTCAIVGHDGKIYMGTLGGTVQVLSYHAADLRVSGQCYSKPIKDTKYVKDGKPAVRDILGITIDPRDIEIRPYVSTMTLYWLDRDRLDNPLGEAWRNGAVDRLKPGTDQDDAGVCLVYDERIVSHLPVSNHDHGVNALLFSQEGDLLISVGGFSNMGLPGWKLGGLWETHLSAAVLKAKLSDINFTGTLDYDNEDLPRLAKLKPGQLISVFATGIRNGFAMAITKSGEIYVVDQGPNCTFGDTATECEDYDEMSASNWDPKAKEDWQGKVKHGWSSCPYGISRSDKLLHVTEGAYFGHPNLNRGGDECIWVDPADHLTADDKAPPSSYKEHVVTLKSPVTGIGEYGANHFCGDLRGELIMSTYKNGNTYRLSVGDKAGKSEIAEVLSDSGGLTFIENAIGDLIFPQLIAKKVFVLRPERTPKVGVFVAGAVPWRHGMNGGTILTVGGEGFGAMPQVLVGGNNCEVLGSGITEIKCVVPPGAGLVDVEVVAMEGGSGRLEKGVLYMVG